MKIRMSGALLFLAIVCGIAQEARAAIIINEILADPAGDANRDGEIHTAQDEFVELLNTASQAVSLSQWSLSDRIRQRHLFAESDRIPGHGFFVVFGGGSPQGFSSAGSASSGGLGLNNGGDTITLRDMHGIVVDQIVYGSSGGRDVALTRSPDGDGEFVQHSSVNESPFSPGLTVDGRSRLVEIFEPLPEPQPLGMEESSPVMGYAEEMPPLADTPVVPEPSSLILLSLGIAGLRFWRQKVY